MLSRLATCALMAMVVAACASVPPSPTDPPPPAQVAARWVAEDGTVVALNLVVALGTNPEQQRTFAERERSQHPGARVIVRIFAATAGSERYVIGHMPVGTEPLAQASPSATLLAIYDFARLTARGFGVAPRTILRRVVARSGPRPSHRR